MPELPEVQSTVDYLAPKITGRTIKSCSVLWPRSLATHSDTELNTILSGKKITNVSRRGKYITIWLGSSALLVHLRMSGTLEVLSSDISKDPYDRFILTLNGDKELRFNDVRKFGKIYFCDNPEIVLGKLGVEPLSEQFSVEVLSAILNRKKGAIKPLLLNQNLIAGIGNIYADESLWLSKIHPTRKADSLKKREISALYSAIVEVLNEAILFKGTDNGDYVVEGGMYSPKVYGRSEAACNRCGHRISKIVVGQRGTHFCGKCQKK